jgi:hypothetical protein
VSLGPEISGRVGIQSPGARFLAAFQQRVAAGQLMGQPHPRANYQVVSVAPDRLAIRAADWRTALNVGLNDVELRLTDAGSVQYRVRYWRWTQFGIMLCGVLGVTGLVLLLATDARAYMENTVTATVPGLSADQNLAIAWGMTLFWGFAWPWILVALHKRPLHKLMARLIGEVDATAR